jgi:hypothetical protein
MKNRNIFIILHLCHPYGAKSSYVVCYNHDIPTGL